MSRSDGSAYPNRPSAADVYDIRGHFRWENDEILMPMSDEEHQALDDAFWPLLAGDVIQPHCPCGKWASTAQCEECSRELRLIEDESRAAERRRRDVEAWKRMRKHGGDAA